MGVLGSTIDRLGPLGRIVTVAVGLATIGIVFYLVSTAGAAAYTPAFTNLDPKQAGKVEAALASAGIPSKLSGNGTAVLVPSSQLAQASVAVAQAGAGGGGGNGGMTYQDVMNLGMNATDAKMKVAIQQAMSSDLASQVEQLSGVQHATVTLAMPADTIFSADQKQPTASVLIDTGANVLPSEAVRSIVMLVSSGVPGLTPENVRVADTNGTLLSSAGTALGLATADQMDATRAWNSQQSAIGQDVLDKVLGPGHSTVVVAGTLNFDQTSTTSRTFGNKAIVLQGTNATENYKSASGSTAGGVTANTPGAAAGGTNGSTYNKKATAATNGVDVTDTTNTVAPGQLKAMTVSITVDQSQLDSINKSLPAGGAPLTLQSLQAMVSSAVGAQTGRDQVTATSVPKMQDPTQLLKKIGAVTLAGGTAAGVAAASANDPFAILGPAAPYAKPGLAILGLLVLLFFVRRGLKKRQELLGSTDSSWLPALEAPPIRIEELMPAVLGPSQAEITGAQKKQLQTRVEELAGARPAEVAMQLRGWLSAE